MAFARIVALLPAVLAIRGLVIAFIVLAGTISNAQNEGFVGVYIWGGQLESHPGIQGFYDTVDLALKSGFDTIRFKLGPGQVKDYSMTPDPCSSNKSLACYAKVMFASPVWDNPSLRRVMLTTVDFTCFAAGGNANIGCMKADLLDANKAKIEVEYMALLRVLQARFASHKVQFVISNWEGDNFVLCGNSYGYGKGGAVARLCDADFFSRAQTKIQRLHAFLQWVGYKDEAIANFLAANPGANIISAPEFNNYQQFANGCASFCAAGAPSSDSVLGQIAAAGGRQYCSYSSYDSQGGSGSTFFTNVKKILTVCRNLIIGEAGYDLSRTPAATDAGLFQALHQLRSIPGVLGVIPWHAVDAAGTSTEYGFWDSSGNERVLPLLGPLRPKPR